MKGFTNRALNKSLPLNMAVFCHYLRGKGYQTSLREELDAVQCLKLIDLENEDQFYQALRSALAKSKKELNAFDRHYHDFWAVFKNPHVSRRDGENPTPERKQQTIKLPDRKAPMSVIDWFQGKDSPTESGEAAGYSAQGNDENADLTSLAFLEPEDLELAVKQLGRKLANKNGRRYRCHPSQGEFDLASTLRKNFAKSDELAELYRRKKKLKKLKLDLVCDVSKSMDLYSRFMIRFMTTFKNLFSRIEVYVFGTELYRVSEQLEGEDFEEILKKLGDENPGWSGGTRMGYCLDRYLNTTKPPDRNTTVMIISDGWDAGDIELLGDSMREIQNRSRKTIWLNPLKSSPDYQPRTQGMITALPYIDHFTSLHNQKTLETLIMEI